MGFFAKLDALCSVHLARLSEQKHLRAVRDGMISILPMTIIGSIFLILGNLPIDSASSLWETNFILNWLKINRELVVLPYFVTMGIVALYVSFNIAYSLSRTYNLDPSSGATLSVLAFLMTILELNVVQSASKAGLALSIPMNNLGGSGLFVAIFTSIFAVEVLRFFKQSGFYIRMPEGVPDSVARSFENILPAGAIIFIMWLLVNVFGVELHTLIGGLFAPLKYVLNSPGGVLLVVFLNSLLWAFGIHGSSVIAAVSMPIWTEMLLKNTEAFNAQQPIPFIAIEPFYQWFIYIGGSGATLGLAIAVLLFARSSYLKNLGKATVIPSFFNINEPMIFGMPIMLNPVLIIPFIIAPLVLAGISYASIALGLVNIPVFVTPWTSPFFIGAYLATVGDWRAVILSTINVIIATMIYTPFVIAYDKQMQKQEKE